MLVRLGITMNISVRRFSPSFLFLPFLLGIFMACESDVAFSQFRTLPTEGWDRTDTLYFEIDSLATSGTYVAILSLRTTSAPSYPYTDVTLEVSRAFAARTQHVETVTFPLNNKNGVSTGKGTSLYLHDFPLDTLTLSTGDYGVYKVGHLMRHTPLPGIRDVGLTLERVE